MHDPLTGLIAVDKPAGVSSRHVVDVVRRALGTRSVGHAGTLDPLARGVMIACVGNATRLVDFLHELPKRYGATFLLGRSSPSDDLETPVVEEPDPVRPAGAAVIAAIEGFRGEIMQRPCDYSAVHVDGKRAYRLARGGKEFDLPEKRVRIDRLDVIAYDWPRLELDIECSAGTYVRAIGRDLAAALGTRALMESLVRTAAGQFGIGECVPLDELARLDMAAARALLVPAARGVDHLPSVLLTGPQLDEAVRGGLLEIAAEAIRPPAVAVATATGAGDALAAVDGEAALVGILRKHDRGGWRLKPNFRGAG